MIKLGMSQRQSTTAVNKRRLKVCRHHGMLVLRTEAMVTKVHGGVPHFGKSVGWIYRRRSRGEKRRGCYEWAEDDGRGSGQYDTDEMLQVRFRKKTFFVLDSLDVELPTAPTFHNVFTQFVCVSQRDGIMFIDHLSRTLFFFFLLVGCLLLQNLKVNSLWPHLTQQFSPTSNF